VTEAPAPPFRRDGVTWLAYAMLGWFAYLQAAVGLVVPHLREELDFGYTVAGLHVAAFAAGSTLAGLTARLVEARIGRRALFWAGACGMGAGAACLVAARRPELTLAAMTLMGAAGAMLLVTIQAVLSDRHGERRSIALTEANVVAGLGYVALSAAFALAAALAAGWRAAILAVLLVLPLAWLAGRRAPLGARPRGEPADASAGRLPPAFWIVAVFVFCAAAVEWCLTAWGAALLRDTTGVSVDAAVGLMGAYFAGVVVGRAAGSVLARRVAVAPLAAGALACAAAGVAVLWAAEAPVTGAAGLLLAGIGVGNLFPLGLALAVATAPGLTTLASARVTLVASVAILIGPLLVGRLADAADLTAALGVVPACLAVAAAALAVSARRPTALGA
jgi:predicted MFS family arabinose efflux permease